VEELRRSRSSEEAQALGQRLNGVVELANHLMSVSGSVAITVEGSVRIVKIDEFPQEGEATYDLVFAGYGGGSASNPHLSQAHLRRRLFEE
jgi:hypothetical protein